MQKVADRIGATVGVLCALHCAATGILLGTVSAVGLGKFFAGPLEIAFFATSLLIGVLAMARGFREHRSFLPGLFFLAGLGLLVIRHELFGHEHHGNQLLPILTSVLGGALLVAFHWLNSRLSHAASACNCCGNLPS